MTVTGDVVLTIEELAQKAKTDFQLPNLELDESNDSTIDEEILDYDQNDFDICNI